MDIANGQTYVEKKIWKHINKDHSHIEIGK